MAIHNIKSYKDQISKKRRKSHYISYQLDISIDDIIFLKVLYHRRGCKDLF